MRKFLHFELSDEQFEDLVKYLGIDNLYVDEFYIANLLYDGCVNQKVAIKIFRFLNEELQITESTFIKHCEKWFKDDIESLPDEIILEEYFSGSSFQDICSGVHYSVEDFKISEHNVLMQCRNLDKDQYFEDCWDVTDAELSARKEMLQQITEQLQEAIEKYEDIDTHKELSLSQKKDGL